MEVEGRMIDQVGKRGLVGRWTRARWVGNGQKRWLNGNEKLSNWELRGGEYKR